ncbi:MAG TPA: dehydrogenase [Flavobacteriales bacterium]|jgi:NAD(P)-dependent dehydrogenase (short-subunit alcohol dehydrogenase family)|nr:dehydrogenase [Flavobacteriales bacterium]
MTDHIKTQHLENVLKNHGQDMTGKVVAVTGTTSGTGYVCARELAKKGAKVILLNRKSERAQSSLRRLQDEVPDGSFTAIACDLQNLDSVRSAIDTIKTNHNVLDVLVNNAGVMAMKDQATVDGYDVQMQTNVLSHFLLTKELFPLLKKSKEGRIVNHSSMARLGGPLKPEYFGKNGGNLGGDVSDDPENPFRSPRWERYHQTKLANAVFTYGLKEKLQNAEINNVLPFLAHPGLALTNLQVTTAADGGMDADSDFMNQAQTAEDGATGIIRAAMDPEAKAGDFFGPEQWTGYPDRIEPEELLLDASNIRINWEGCEKAVGKFEF